MHDYWFTQDIAERGLLALEMELRCKDAGAGGLETRLLRDGRGTAGRGIAGRGCCAWNGGRTRDCWTATGDAGWGCWAGAVAAGVKTNFYELGIL